MTHALGVAASAGSMQHISVASMSDSDHIGDIVPGIEVDEAAVEEALAKRSRNSNLTNMTTDVEIPPGGLGVPGSGSGKERNNMGTMIVHHPDTGPSVQVELSQVAEVEDDLDQVLMDM